jgi:hypothetical protein
VTVSGAFYGQSHVALYDVTVDTFPKPVARIEVSAGKSGSPLTFLGAVDFPPDPYVSLFTGLYDNSTSTYVVRVVTKYTDATIDVQYFSLAAVANQNLMLSPV